MELDVSRKTLDVSNKIKKWNEDKMNFVLLNQN